MYAAFFACLGFCRAARRKRCSDHTGAKIAIRPAGMRGRAWRRKPRQPHKPALSRRKDRHPDPAAPAGCVKARSSTLQPCSQSISSTESTASKSAGSQPMSPGSTSNTLELPAARQVMPLPAASARSWLAVLPLSTAHLRRRNHVHPQVPDLEEAQPNRR